MHTDYLHWLTLCLTLNMTQQYILEGNKLYKHLANNIGQKK